MWVLRQSAPVVPGRSDWPERLDQMMAAVPDQAGDGNNHALEPVNRFHDLSLAAPVCSVLMQCILAAVKRLMCSESANLSSVTAF